MQNESPFSIRDTIREGRSFKEEAKEKGIRLQGAEGEELEKVIERAIPLIANLEHDHLVWIEEKRQLFSEYLGDISWEEIKDTYNKGFSLFIRLQYRLFKKEFTKENVGELFDESYLTDIALAYTFDFIRSLRTSQRLDIFPRTALTIAKKSYSYNPDIIISLFDKFPEFEPGIIAYTLIKNPSNPESFLNKVKETIPKLQKKFPLISRGDILRAAIHHPNNPDAYIMGE